ncbi:MAG TPA: hypothetical protein VGE07_15680 [Herpetosiphonaceae bacterium]
MTDASVWPDDEPVLQTQWGTAPHTLIIRGNEAGLRELRELLDSLIAKTNEGAHYHLDRGISLLDGVCSLILQRGALRPPNSDPASAPDNAWLLPTDIPPEVIALVNRGNPLLAMKHYHAASTLSFGRIAEIVSALNRVRQAGLRLEPTDASGAADG